MVFHPRDAEPRATRRAQAEAFGLRSRAPLCHFREALGLLKEKRRRGKKRAGRARLFCLSFGRRRGRLGRSSSNGAEEEEDVCSALVPFQWREKSKREGCSPPSPPPKTRGEPPPAAAAEPGCPGRGKGAGRQAAEPLRLLFFSNRSHFQRRGCRLQRPPRRLGVEAGGAATRRQGAQSTPSASLPGEGGSPAKARRGGLGAAQGCAVAPPASLPPSLRVVATVARLARHRRKCRPSEAVPRTPAGPARTDRGAATRRGRWRCGGGRAEPHTAAHVRTLRQRRSRAGGPGRRHSGRPLRACC